MKKHFSYSIVLAALSSGQVFAGESSATVWGPVGCGLQMSISLPEQNRLNTNMPFNILISYKNVSTNKIVIYEASDVVHDSSYSFKIIAPSGNDVSPDLRNVIDTDSGVAHFVATNQTTEINYPLTHFCKFDKLGTYKIVARKRFETCDVVSNPLYVTVVPGDWKPQKTNSTATLNRF